MCSVTRLVAAAVVAMSAGAGAAVAQTPSAPSGSSELARTLVARLDAHQMQAIAVRDPADATRFIAALYVPGTELLVVSGPYTAPAMVEQQLARAEYRDVYVELQSARSSVGREFIEDLQANGLHVARTADEPFDIVFQGDRETRFNGDWAGQGLTEGEYTARFSAAEAAYVRMLTLLIGQLRPTT